jgi:Icc-related predicted phosphoesterase
VLLAGCIGAASSLLALPLIPAVKHDLGPATVSADVSVGRGDTVLVVPPLGTISAGTHPAPLRLNITFAIVDFEALGHLATTPSGRDGLRADIDADLRALAVRVALQIVIGGAVVGSLVAAAIWHLRWAQLASGAGGGFAVMAALVLLTAATFELDAFKEPRFTGTLASAPQVIQTLQERVSVLDELRSRYDVATQRLSNLLVLMTKPDRDLRSNTDVLVHVSDIHANPIGLEITRQLAQDFDADAVLDTGDLGSSTIDTGELTKLAVPLDNRLAKLIQDIRVPYLFVPGNHDSPQLRSALRGTDNVRVLDGKSASVGKLQILGWGDPTFSTEPTRTKDDNEERLEASKLVANRASELEPDLIGVHDERLAHSSIGEVPLIVSGHTHRRGFEEVDGTLVLTVGSTGATGLESFTVEAEMDYEAEVLYFRSRRLVAVDYVRFRGLGSDFEVERKTVAVQSETALSGA